MTFLLSCGWWDEVEAQATKVCQRSLLCPLPNTVIGGSPPLDSPPLWRGGVFVEPGIRGFTFKRNNALKTEKKYRKDATYKLFYSNNSSLDLFPKFSTFDVTTLLARLRIARGVATWQLYRRRRYYYCPAHDSLCLLHMLINKSSVRCLTCIALHECP